MRRQGPLLVPTCSKNQIRYTAVEGLSDSLSHIQKDERTALMSASMGGHLDVMRELLKAQAEVNIQDKVSAES